MRALGRMERGSFTVELACLTPLILLVLLGSIYLCFYVHNRAWLTAAAYESALAGCQEMSTGGEEQAARQRGRSLLAPRLFGAENLRMEVRREGAKLLVRFEGDTIASYGGLAWHLCAEGQEKLTDPVAFIWKAKGLEGLAGE